MRGLLLVVATGVMIYIAYYLDHYTSLRQQVRQIWYPSATVTPVPEKLDEEEGISAAKSVGTTALSAPASPPPLTIDPLLRQIQANDQRGLDDGVASLVAGKFNNHSLTAPEKELLTQALVREGLNRWLSALQPLMHLSLTHLSALLISARPLRRRKTPRSALRS